ncbi:MAG: sulfate adenylyltransferase [Pseudonocardiales bacterium]|nr:sulfate adenylyltransferase [Pseudonocardiales bacterium]MBV9727925.1 sulfate adenylyltransferase [Pseudonocardiales bacterium]
MAALTSRPCEQVSSLLRLTTAGSVDDGKSTLVGRLLHDTQSILVDQLAAVDRATRARGGVSLDLALLTDGLRAEREQGITIDVAYRYFATPTRKFVLADCPGHVQYTRNTVTGASTAELAVVLVDARNGLVEQTRRHLAVMAFLRVPHVVLAVNKMDLVDFDEPTFRRIESEFTAVASSLGVPDVMSVPVSALHGDNVATRSRHTGWYQGPTLLEHLEAVPAGREAVAEPMRFPVQLVLRPRTPEHPDYRGLAGRVASGVLKVGDDIVALPSGGRSTVVGIDTPDGPMPRAAAGQSITVLLRDEIDAGRGEVLAHPEQPPRVVTELDADLCWLAEAPLRAGARVLVKHGTRTVQALVTELTGRLDLHTLRPTEAPTALELNEIGGAQIRLAQPLAVDSYATDRHTGNFLVIDATNGNTLAAGLVGPAA